jgi:hypothetical protein
MAIILTDIEIRLPQIMDAWEHRTAGPFPPVGDLVQQAEEEVIFLPVHEKKIQTDKLDSNGYYLSESIFNPSASAILIT